MTVSEPLKIVKPSSDDEDVRVYVSRGGVAYCTSNHSYAFEIGRWSTKTRN